MPGGYQTDNYEEQGGNVWVVGGKLNILAGGSMQLNGVDVGLIVGGSHTVTAGEQTAGTLNIATGLTSIGAQIVQIIRSGNEVNGAAISASGANIVVATNGATYVVTTGDVINWLAIGTP